jgi:hypothetical protein
LQNASEPADFYVSFFKKQLLVPPIINEGLAIFSFAESTAIETHVNVLWQ